MGNEFRCIGCIRFYRSFHFRAYPSCWFSLCMAKRSLGMVLTEYSEKKKKEGKDSIETIMSLIEFPLLDQTSSNSVISTTPNDLSNWSRLSSLWPLLYGTSCCFIEFASLIGSRFDFDRYGLVPRSSPRQIRPAARLDSWWRRKSIFPPITRRRSSSTGRRRSISRRACSTATTWTGPCFASAP